jgi:cyclopropane-fatty-acyl-phospholipid synthase
MSLIGLAERGLLPDALVRLGIRRLNRRRLADEELLARARARGAAPDFEAELAEGPLAVATDEANEQHYEVPADFFRLCLGHRLKYSCCDWSEGAPDLDAAEERMLALTAERAAIADGMSVLELGCGWGSLSLWLAERFPASPILAVSNSSSQGDHVRAEARRRRLDNLEVRTADMNGFDPGRRFDRVVSVEMFEHMRNWQGLLGRIATWLEPGGRLFVHVFCHARFTYPFEAEGEDNWMGRHFFTGGIMPSAGLIRRFDRDLEVEQEWRHSGHDYRRTAEAWLARLDRNRAQARAVLARLHGPGEAGRALGRWRIFFLACAELWGHGDGREWLVAHYRLRHRAPAGNEP